jgi:hypothetical protein
VADSVSGAIFFFAATDLAEQWGLNAWPNVLITLVLGLVTLWLAWRRGFSPLEMISGKADRALVKALQRHYPRSLKNLEG